MRTKVYTPILNVGDEYVVIDDGSKTAMVPAVNCHVKSDNKGQYILLPSRVFHASKLPTLSLEVQHGLDPTYTGIGHVGFADWHRPFIHKNQKYIVFGFDKSPRIVVESKYSAILAIKSEDHKDEIYSALGYEFGNISGVISSREYEYLGDLYEVVENNRESRVSDALKKACREYVPEAFPSLTKPPSERVYESEFERIYAETNWQTAAKEVFYLFKKLQTN